MSQFLELTKEDRDKFLASVLTDPTGRMACAAKRMNIATDKYADLVIERIDEVYTDPMVKKQVGMYAKSSYLNPLVRITNRLNVAYKHPPVRSLDDAPEDAQEKFRLLIRDGKISTCAKNWLRWVLIMNVVIVVPRVKPGNKPKLIWDMYLPHRCQVITDPDDATEVTVLGSIWESDAGIGVEVIDDAASYYYTQTVTKSSVGGKPDEVSYQLVDLVPHDVGEFPGTVFRVKDPVCDFWSSSEGDSLVTVTIDVGRIAAEMSWVRKSQNRKQTYIATDNIDQVIPHGQLLTAEGPLEVNTSSTNFTYQALDINTPIDGFKAHIDYLMADVAERHGLPSYMINLADKPGDEPSNAVASAAGHDALSTVRDDQVSYLRVAEEDLMWKTAAVASQHNHPFSVDPNVVRDTYKVIFPPLSYIDDPLRKIQYWSELIKLNIGVSQVDACLDRNPDLTREQATDLIKRGLDERIIPAEFQSSTNVASDPVVEDDAVVTSEHMSAAEQNGAKGGSMSPADDEEEDQAA